MKKITNSSLFRSALLVAAAAILCYPNAALAQTSELFSGEVIQGNSTVGPVFDSATGNTVFVRQTLGAPMPVKSNVNSMVPVYIVAYPTDSQVPEADLQCLPTNCDHLNVLPFPAPNYTAGDPAVCQTWNGGTPCALLKGHIHLFGVAKDGGDFTAQHFVELLLFTPQAFAKCQVKRTTGTGDCPYDTLVRTTAQMDALQASGDLTMPLDTPITVTLSVVPEQTYELGTPTNIPFP